MLADLSDDCTRFVRKFDESRLDPVKAAIALNDFDTMLRNQYVGGDMWLRKEGTYAARIQQMLQEAQVAHFGQEYIVIRKPTGSQTQRCRVEVVNVARGIKADLKSQFPNCRIDRKSVV
jgi:hypothetical protein